MTDLDRESPAAKPQRRSILQQRYLYRGFKEDVDAAAAFCRGDICLSTLRICRTMEAEKGGDPDEGSRTILTGRVAFGDNTRTPEQERLVQERLGPFVGNPKHVVFDGFAYRSEVFDAHVLCFSSDLDSAEREFGPVVVQVRHPKRFFERVCREVKNDVPDLQARIDFVQYQPREVELFEEFNEVEIFVKDPSFEPEHEIRIACIPANITQHLKRLRVHAPWAGNLCERVR